MSGHHGAGGSQRGTVLSGVGAVAGVSGGDHRVVPSESNVVTMDWADAMRAVQHGLSVQRVAWPDPAVRVQRVEHRLAILIDGGWADWIVSDEDMLARDWVI